MKKKSTTQPRKLMCSIGIHKDRVIEVKFGFGGGGKVETVQCERCGRTTVRQKR